MSPRYTITKIYKNSWGQNSVFILCFLVLVMRACRHSDLSLTIRRDEHRADSTVYKYMNLAYLSPKIIGDILDGEVPTHINLQTLFCIAEKHSDFGKQESAFYRN